MRLLQYRSFFLINIFILFPLCVATRDSLTPLQPLYDNETLISLDGHFALGFFTPPNSQNRYIGVWYYKIAVQTVVWVANRQNPLTNSIGTLSITANGTLKITNQDSIDVWSTTTTGLTAPVAQLLNNGNFVVKQDVESSGYSWQGFDHPTDTLLPGMKLGINRTTGFIYTLTAWKSNHDPSPGEYYLAMDANGDPQMFLYAGPFTQWRSGPWAGFQLNGIPEINNYTVFSFVNNNEEVTYSYFMQDQSIVSRLVVTPLGMLQRLFWIQESEQWDLFWMVPRALCDRYGECGPYGACDPNNSTVCSCLPGFVAKDSVQQVYKDESVVCTRKTELDCSGGTDGFVALRGVKLPDTTNCTVDLSLSLDECRALCLKNCVCTAYAGADVRQGGSGCVIWLTELSDIRLQSDHGQDLYVRVSAADIGLASGHSHKKKMTVAIVVSFISVIFLLACVCCFLWKKKKRTGVAPGHSHKTGMAVVNRMKLLLVILLFACVGWFQWKRKKRWGDSTLFSDQSSKEAEKNGLDLPLFGFGTIAAATDYFATENKLGEGGFGPVYKGKLGESQEIAVKRLAKTSQQGTDEFKNEVMLIAKLQHRNLVRLLGYCIQGVERMLIYEYMPNKSLDAFLFDKEKGALLDWKTRYQIIIGITRGLLYLHHDSRFRIIHRDLKASNILLDKEMTPKISDFGMARIFGGDETDFNTRKVVGTYGYMSPEYAMAGIFSMKSDVFSFGVLVLEIISGRKNRGAYSFPPHINLVAHVWSLWNEGKSLQIVHESMNDSFPPEEVLKCVKVGLLCVQERPEDRPLMSSVVVMLGSASDIASLPQPNQPGFIASTSPLETHPPASRKQESCTLNDLTISLDGR